MKRIIVARNLESSMFLIKILHRNWFEKIIDIFFSNRHFYETDDEMVYIKSEGYIVDKIKRNMDFHTINGKGFTPVQVIGNHIRSKPNKTKKDNISNLPIRIL